MKTKYKFYMVVVTLIIFVFCLTGCLGKDIAFKIEKVDVVLNSEYSSDNIRFQMLNKITTEEELKAFFNNEYFGMDTASKLTLFDDNYFKVNSLLFVCYPTSYNESIQVAGVARKSSELFVIINRHNQQNASSHYSYLFVTIAKDELQNINKLSYVIKTI